ncbi:MAG: hypothetical protein LBD03_01775 [Methanobrevibacter sp.]|jgi:hypothetical protein|nr:hypothetical protein [Candidatus Methanovirga procula]
MFKKFFGLFILLIFLVANLGSPIAVKYSKPGFKEVLSDTLDIPLNNCSLLNKSNFNNSSINPVTTRIKYFNSNATIGELIAIQTMMYDQLNNGKTDFDINLYYDYLNNSSTYPITGVDLTARELYEQAQGVHDFIDGLDGILIKYSHMTRDEKVDFLLTKSPSNEVTQEILEDADADELDYLTDNAFTALDNIPDYDYEDISMASTIKNDIEDRVNKFNVDMQHYDKAYQINSFDKKNSKNNPLTGDFNVNDTNNTTALKELRAEYVAELDNVKAEKEHCEKVKKKFIKAGTIITGIGLGCVALSAALCFLVITIVGIPIIVALATIGALLAVVGAPLLGVGDTGWGDKVNALDKQINDLNRRIKDIDDRLAVLESRNNKIRG